MVGAVISFRMFFHGTWNQVFSQMQTLELIRNRNNFYLFQDSMKDCEHSLFTQLFRFLLPVFSVPTRIHFRKIICGTRGGKEVKKAERGGKWKQKKNHITGLDG